MTTPTTSCEHCGFPLPAGSVAAGRRPFCCYGCYLVHEITGQGGEGARFNLLVARLLVGAFFSMLVMVFSIPLYSDAIYSASGGGHPVGPLAPIFRWISFGAAIPVLALLGVPVLHNAVRTGFRASVDVLILAGVLSAFTVSAIHLFRGEGQIYFETTSMLLVLLTAGRALEAAGKSRAASAFRDLLDLSPDRARLLSRRRDGPHARPGTDEEVLVPSDTIRPGDLLRVLPGERFPVDGDIVSGSSSVDRSLVTGESAVVPCDAGDEVHAGTLNVDGVVILSARRVIGERLLDRVVTLLEDARSRRGALDRTADALARWFLPVALCVAAGTFLYWQPRTGSFQAFLHALSTLLIACPCALGIAAPLAIWTGIREAARVGALVRSGEVLESLARPGLMVFDKTGTLTSPELEIERIEALPGVSERDVLELAGSLGRESLHPVSRALAGASLRAGLEPLPLQEARSLPGRGVIGRLGGDDVVLGSPRFVRESIAGDRPTGRPETGTTGASVLVARAGRVLGAAWLREQPRPEAHTVIGTLRDLGFDLAMITGDVAARGEEVAAELGLCVSAGLLPTDKVEWVERARREHPDRVVSMVGDGLNDAPVLAVADVGIAVGSSVDLVRETADVVLFGPGGAASLAALPRLVQVARSTHRRIRFYLAWAFGYNSVGLAFAAAGLVHPLLAAVLMVTSSLFVIGATLPGADAAPVTRAPSTAERTRTPAG